jgi:thiol:disulfide interchange protein DsbC
MLIRGLQKALLAAGIFIAQVSFGAQDVSEEQVEKLRAALNNPAMGMKVQSVEASEMPGVYAVQLANGPVLYANADGSFFIVGDLHANGPGGLVNLTEKRRDAARLEMLAVVKPEDMIIFSPEGETRAHVTVFTDVTCYYCQKLHLEVPELNRLGIEVRYLAYPRAGVGSPGYNKLATAWCAEDRQDTLTRLKAKQTVAERVCESNPVADQFQLGAKVGVRGTPAIVTAQGKLIPGYQPAAELAANIGVR